MAEEKKSQVPQAGPSSRWGRAIEQGGLISELRARRIAPLTRETEERGGNGWVRPNTSSSRGTWARQQLTPAPSELFTAGRRARIAPYTARRQLSAEGGQGAGGHNVKRIVATASRHERNGAGQHKQARALADERAGRSATTLKKQRADSRRPAARYWSARPVWRRWHPHEVTTHGRQAARLRLKQLYNT
jgi:hypothetical protein